MIHERLKTETEAEHRAVEAAVERLGSFASADGYRRLLERFWGFYAPLEPQIAAHPGWAQHDMQVGRRMKAASLARDLAALGHTPETLGALPRCQDLPAPGDFPHTLGCMYVLEGATLGGQIIARQVRTALGLTPERGASFFSSYGRDVGPMWREFRALLAAAAPDEGAEERALAGARETFRAMRGWIEDGGTR